MQLTGKCKEDFLNYYWDVKIDPLPITMCKKEDLELFFDSICELFQHALILEWFDSINLYITIESVAYQDVFDCSFVGFKYNFSSGSFDTRIEATNEAILNSDRVYNEYHANPSKN